MASTFPLIVQEHSRVHRAITIAVFVAVALAVYLAPFVLPGFRLNQISGALVLVIAIVGLNLLSGFGGQISLGHAAFFGLGAYTTGILTVDHGVPVVIAMLLSIVVCFCAGVIVGLPALRLQGTYLALVTLAVGILFPTLIRRFDDLTGGSRGLQDISFRPPEGLAYFSGALGRTIWIFWAVSIALALCCLVVRNIMRSGLGRGIVALRDKEAAGVVMGVNRAFVRTVLFGISAAIAGVAGGFFAVINGIITPDSFTLLLTINLLVGMLIGGSASFWGADHRWVRRLLRAGLVVRHHRRSDLRRAVRSDPHRVDLPVPERYRRWVEVFDGKGAQDRARDSCIARPPRRRPTPAAHRVRTGHRRDHRT
ncbi:branched-chain amino acid ABC transporter permease [Rhodococcus baikonurensis]|uniref:branched-chain amino acid ABC transporter permease n=1 Tax=Rhodococcus baikonurensis TaxID=172041 RepID=UPI0037B62597